jgi:hypothetical protein
MNPMKKEWPGEMFSAGSAKLGTFKKYVPFDGNPYHIPQIIYDMIQERKCSTFYTERDERGREKRVSRLIKEFAIEDLAPLTSQELEDLAKVQALRGTGL